jgi:predicted nucleotidyltransferase
MKEGKTYANINIGFLTPIFNFKAVVILTNWVFQGLLYADRTERAFKIILDITLTVVLFFAIPLPNAIIRLEIAFLISHTFYWIFNGQLFALAKNFGVVHNEPQRIIDYANEIKERATKEKSIACVAVYGSLSREEIKSTSDLDVRIIRKTGFINGFNACMFGFRERNMALFNKFPLDLFVVDSPKHLLNMRSDEIPQLLYDPNNILKKQMLV